MNRVVIIIALLITLLIVPAHSAGTGDAADVWPLFAGTDNSGPDNGYMIFYDQGSAAWDTPRLIVSDMLDNQMSVQRDAIGYADDTWNVSLIETTSQDLEVWASPDTDWQDENGSWTLIDDDATEDWEGVDVEVRRGYLWVSMYQASAGGGAGIQSGYIDMLAGSPAFTIDGSIWTDAANTAYSLVLDRNLYGTLHLVDSDGSGAVNYASSNMPPDTYLQVTVQSSSSFPKIIVDNEQRLWAFFIESGGNLWHNTGLDDPGDPDFEACGIVAAVAASIGRTHDEVWCKLDDTIHVVWVDTDAGTADSTTLNYKRRTLNGLTSSVTLLTVDSTLGGDGDGIAWPQISMDVEGNIQIFYIFEDIAGLGGDIRGFYLDHEDYDDFTTVGTWSSESNIDGGASTWIWLSALDNVPISCQK